MKSILHYLRGLLFALLCVLVFALPQMAMAAPPNDPPLPPPSQAYQGAFVYKAIARYQTWCVNTTSRQIYVRKWGVLTIAGMSPDGFSWYGKYGNGNGTVVCRRQDFYGAYKVKR